MARALALACLTLLAALGVVAAPALSSRPYVPEPEQFTLAVAAGAVLGDPDPGEGVVSEPLRAPQRFNLVGFTWRDAGTHAGDDHGPALAIRTRLDGGEWTRWAPVEAHPEDGPDPIGGERDSTGMSNPVWAGEADWVQYRSSEPLDGLEAHFVNVDGTASGLDRLQSAIRGVAHDAVVATAALVGDDLAGAAEPEPDVVRRAEWGASKCKPRVAPSHGEVRAAVIHHTVNPNDYSQSEAPQIVLGICLYHRNTNGWNDIGYNFLVDRFGTLYEGRSGGLDAAVIAAHAEGFNAQTTGIANIGTFSEVTQSAAALDSTARLIRWKLPLHGYPTNGRPVLVSAGGSTNRYPSGAKVRLARVHGHRDTSATACPGDLLYAQLGDLRRRVGEVSPSGIATNVTAALASARTTIRHGEAAEVTGTLLALDGEPIAGQPVAVQTLIRRRWRTTSEPVTGADGSFATSVAPARSRSVRVRFAGAGELRSSVTPPFTIAVRPVFRLRAPGGGFRPGDRVRVRGRVLPRKPRVYQVLRLQRDRGRFRRAGIRVLETGRRGFFRGSFVPAGNGVYRVYFIAKGGKVTARGGSERLDVPVGAAARARMRARGRDGGVRAP